MKILGVIPARGGSKGVPKKNIKLLGGVPLLKYTSDVALKSKLLTKVVLSTDDDDIMNCGIECGLEVPFKRPDDLAKDTSPTLPVILHTLDYYSSKNEEFDAVCLLQPTSPFRTLEFLDKALDKFINSDVDSLVSVLEVPHEYNPHWVFETNNKGMLSISTGENEIISRRQDLPKAFHRDGSIYITKVSVLRGKNSLYGDSMIGIESSRNSYVNIDKMEDWDLAESMLKRM